MGGQLSYLHQGTKLYATSTRSGFTSNCSMFSQKRNKIYFIHINFFLVLSVCDPTSHFLCCSTTSENFFLIKHVFYCPCKFIAPRGNILQEQKMSEAKKNKKGISGRKKYIYSFCKCCDPSVCTFLKDHLVQLQLICCACCITVALESSFMSV